MVTSISVTPGHIGQKTDKSNLLTYSITTDGAMTAVTEKVNGVVIGTKTATSGQSLNVGLTQAQWDAVRFGKYGNELIDIAPKTASGWESGSVDVTTGSLMVNNTRIRTKAAVAIANATLAITVNPAYLVYVIEYTAAGAIAKTNSWASTGAKIILAPATTSVRLLLKRTDEGAISATEAETAKLSATYTSTAFSKNTLTVEMGGEKWTYTFEKRVASDADILSAVKAVKDSQEVSLPAVKAQLASAVRGKGGTVSDVASFEAMAAAIAGLTSKKSATGVTTTNGTTLTVGGLNFKPSTVIWFVNTAANMGVYDKAIADINGRYVSNVSLTGVNSSSFRAISGIENVTDTGFSFVYSNNSGVSVNWIAIE